MSDRTDEQAIRAVVSTWMAATKAGDLETVLSLMADDVVFLIAGHPPMIGKDAYATAARAQAQDRSDGPTIDGASTIREIQVLGEWAFLWSELSVRITPPGGAPPMQRAGHTLTLFKRERGRWVLARDANMLAPVPATP